MKNLFYVLSCTFLLSCTGDLVLNKSILDTNIDGVMAVNLGNVIIQNQQTISKFDGEVYAHDSKLIIVDGIGYCAYYGNDSNTKEGAGGQSIRLIKFNIENPKQRKIYDVFKENEAYPTLKIDSNTPCYTPVLFVTPEKKIRILSLVYNSWQQKYYYRDFNPLNETFTDPQICKVSIKGEANLIDFGINNIKKHISYLYGANYNLSTRDMYAASEPVKWENSIYLGLTVGRFDIDRENDEGVTLIMKTNDSGKTFEVLGGPDSRNISPKFCRQFVEGAFDFFNEQNLIFIGRNSLGGMMYSMSKDGGKTYEIPHSLNEACGYSTLPSKPNLVKYKDGLISVWSTTENAGNYNYRTVLEIRYGKNLNICSNPVKIKIKNPFGCHYPSICRYNNSFYLTYTTDSRRLNRNSTGEIVFVKLPF